MDGASGHGNRNGFTLLEVLIASVLMALAMGIGMHCLLAGMKVNSRTLTQGTVQEQARQCLDSMVRELKDSGEGCTGWAIGLNPTPASQFYDIDVNQVSFSRCTGYDAASDLLSWGPVVKLSFQPPQGMDLGKVVRTEGGVQTLICDGVADFHMHYVSLTGELQLTLTVARWDPVSPGHVISASHTTAVKLRN